MKAVVYDKNSESKFRVVEVEKPTPGDDQILIKIIAASINAADYRSVAIGNIPKHKIFGVDISGIVESVGKNVKFFKTGDEVFGDLSGCGFGGFAEYTVAPENFIALKPNNFNFEESTAFPMASITALQALKMAHIKNGDQVMIIGSSGGVGSFAVQLAISLGATVTAVCSGKNIEQTKSIGAHFVINYSNEDFTKSGKKYDAVIAVNGNYSLLDLRRLLNSGGKCIVVGGSYSQILKSVFFGWALSFGSKKISSLFAKPNRSDLEFIATLAEKGVLKPVIETQYPLEQTSDAFRRIKDGHVSGKLVMKVS